MILKSRDSLPRQVQVAVMPGLRPMVSNVVSGPVLQTG
jgi:hypothetical protein